MYKYLYIVIVSYDKILGVGDNTWGLWVAEYL